MSCLRGPMGEEDEPPNAPPHTVRCILLSECRALPLNSEFPDL